MKRIVFHAQSGDTANAPHHVSDPEEVEDDLTDEALTKMAEEFMWESLSPEFWWEAVDDAGAGLGQDREGRADA